MRYARIEPRGGPLSWISLTGLVLTLLAALAQPALAQSRDGTGATRRDVDALLHAYDAIRASLARDSLEGVPAQARTLRLAAGRARERAHGEVERLFAALETAARSLEPVDRDLERMRDRFAELSRALVELVTSGVVDVPRVYVFTCPMARAYGGWVQLDDHIANPYMGARMLSCGTAVESR